MSQKGDQKKAKAAAQQAEIAVEKGLQALILADSFDQKFMPITLEIPRV